MVAIKCKMCGGDMDLSSDKTLGTCEYCGSTMTLPKVDDQQRVSAFDRGNHFRRLGEFDKALLVYERIVQEDENDAEAHWCCALCRFGIEYVKDPVSGEYLPTCHRTSFDSFLEDVDYKAALSHADPIARKQYEKDGERIAAVQRGILSTVQKEDPFDIFICYKENDEQGQRTVDSTLAQDIYYQLTEQGRRVFFARITLEDKAGQEYEPYIFAALHSARVMVVVGTKPEYLSGVWVKNEWSRYLALMKNDRKRLLIPCYRDMDVYDLPEQLSILQSYDMGKIGFIQDLIRGIGKVLDVDKKPEVRQSATTQSERSANLAALLKRGNMALEDQEWDKADAFFERALDMDAECAEAYFGKVLALQRCRTAQKMVQNRKQPEGLKSVFLTACQEDSLRIAAAVKTYAIPQYLSEADIRREMSGFNFSYTSTTEAWREALVQEENYWKQDKLMSRAMRFAQGDFSAQLTAFREDIYDTLKKIADSKAAEDKKHEEKIRTDYATFLDKAEQRVVKLHKEHTTVLIKKRERLARLANMITAYWHIVGLKSNGTVVAVGDNNYGECSVSGWSDVVAVSTGEYHTVGLKSDGTVMAVGDNNCSQCDVGSWADIVAVSAGYDYTVGLKSDGTVVAVGTNDYGECDISDWSGIVAVSAGCAHTIGLKSDGTVVAVGENGAGQCNVNGWSDIVAVSAGGDHTIGLKSDSTVVAMGANSYGQCDVSGWSDIVAVSAGDDHTVGLKLDGTVVAVGDNDAGQCDVSSWSDIVAVSAGDCHSAGLKSDGSVVVAGGIYFERHNMSGWKLFHSIDTLEQERTAAKVHRAAIRQREIAVLKSRQQSLQADLANLKGPFSGKHRKEIEARLTQIEADLKKLQE